MTKKKKHLSAEQQSRIQDFLTIFSQEAPEIRKELAASIPAYNDFLRMYAKTFEEFALLPIAREKGLNYKDPLFDYADVLPSCPFCHEKERIRITGKTYFCSVCKKKFTANHNSISSGTNCSSLTWMKVLRCMLDFYSIEKTCAFCEITPTTFYVLRNRIFYAMQVMLSEVKLYGIIQADNTYVRLSFKGVNLTDQDYPKDSPFYTTKHYPRTARKRGGSYQHTEKNNNYICVFSAIDDRGHSVTRYAGIGIPNLSSLKRAVEEDKFLFVVPEKDPFALHRLYAKGELSASGTVTLFVSDGEKALINYAKKQGLDTESHVYRKDGVQRKLAPDAHDIQRVNGLHGRLKKFFAKTNYVSTKYLPGYLVFFDFLENTGATDEAIAYLFEIIAKPGLGKPAVFYKELYTVPEYLFKLSSDPQLSVYSHMQLRAAYLYAKKLSQKGAEDEITLKFIEEETNYSASTIRKLYKEMKEKELLDTVNVYFENGQEDSFEHSKNVKPEKEISPIFLAMYDEYAEFRKTHTKKEAHTKDFFQHLNKKYDTNYTQNSLTWNFNRIRDLGIRPPLPSHLATSEIYLHRFEEIRIKSLRENTNLTYVEIYEIIAEEYGKSVETITTMIQRARRNNKRNQGEFSK